MRTHVNIGDKSFHILSKLGEGTYGTVYKVNIDGTLYAIKIIPNDLKEGVKTLREIDIMSKLKHPNLVPAVQIITSLNDTSNIGIVMPLADNDLYQQMTIQYNYKYKKTTTGNLLNTRQLLKILYDVSKGLKYIHDNGYIHLDLKPNNILLNNNNASITDFGLALTLDGDIKQFPLEAVTITHRPPEILAGGRIYSKSTDIWSLGMIFMEILSGGKNIFTSYDKNEVIKAIQKYLSPQNITHLLNNYIITYPGDDINFEDFKENAVRLISQMLSIDPSRRPTIDSILSDPLFKNIKDHNINTIEKVIYNTPGNPVSCDIIYYFGFDYLVRVMLQIIGIKTETFFLAADIYQRSLEHAPILTADKPKNWINVVLLVLTSIFMAIKITEPYYPNPSILVQLGLNLITRQDIINKETALIEILGGIVSYKNIATETTNQRYLVRAFDLMRNCHIYHKIDENYLSSWKQHQAGLIKDVKHYQHFTEFIKTTKYYELLHQSPDIYVPILYQQDLAN
jgi:serine/threonine protein kinase